MITLANVLKLRINQLKINRKSFCKLLGLCSASLLVFPLTSCNTRSAAKKMTGHVRIRPVPGEHYSPSFLKFCERSRFQTAKEALRQVRNRTKAFVLVQEHPLA